MFKVWLCSNMGVSLITLDQKHQNQISGNKGNIFFYRLMVDGLFIQYFVLISINFRSFRKCFADDWFVIHSWTDSFWLSNTWMRFIFRSTASLFIIWARCLWICESVKYESSSDAFLILIDLDIDCDRINQTRVTRISGTKEQIKDSYLMINRFTEVHINFIQLSYLSIDQ